MKRWSETRDVLDHLARLRGEGRRAAIATVVRVVGSAYRREGAKLLVAEDGSTRGNVSGGCLEADVREVALQVIATGRPQLRSYCSGAHEVNAWDLGVGCDGRVDVYVEPATEPRHTERALLERDEPFAAAMIVGGDERRAKPGGSGDRPRLVVTASSTEGGLGCAELDAAVIRHVRASGSAAATGMDVVLGQELFIDSFAPPPRLVIIGAGEDARPLAALGVTAGFRVVVVDRRAGLLRPDRFPRHVRLSRSEAADLGEHLHLDHDSFVVAMTHSFADDLEYLRAVVGTPSRYIGVLGPRHRTERLLGILDTEGPLDEARIYGPVGLDLGAEGAEQVALAILAEILAVRAGRPACSLRERMLPIHAAAD
jgi:xanthine dehydrogenase accessory factor